NLYKMITSGSKKSSKPKVPFEQSRKFSNQNSLVRIEKGSLMDKMIQSIPNIRNIAPSLSEGLGTKSAANQAFWILYYGLPSNPEGKSLKDITQSDNVFRQNQKELEALYQNR